MTVFWQFQKKLFKNLKKESGVAGTRTHGRGSVPLMSKSDAADAIPFVPRG